MKKMSQKILSIIVPTYNMENYLSYCLDSFFIRKNFDKLEVIVVNDGSKDKSLEIAQNYVSQASDVFKIVDKKNGNYGSCINAALPVAKGKYVKVVDADDSVNTDNLDEFISFLCENDVDLALSDFVLVNEDRIVTKEIVYHLGQSLMPMEQICVTERFKDMEMHAVTYRTELLLNIGYHQTEGISYTDQQWIFTPMAAVQNVGIFNKAVYKYWVGRAGQTIDPVVKFKKMADRTKYVLGMIAQYERIYNQISPAVKEYLDARLCPNVQDIYLTYFTNMSKMDKNIIYQFDQEFRASSSVIYDYIGSLNPHIRIWRHLLGHFIWEELFCWCFSFIFWFKVTFNHSNR